jgi:hypothetical protein
VPPDTLVAGVPAAVVRGLPPLEDGGTGRAADDPMLPDVSGAVARHDR